MLVGGLKRKKRDVSETSENVEKKQKDESEASVKVKKKSNKKKKRPRQWWMIKKRKNEDKKNEEAEDGAVKEEVNHNENGSTTEKIVANPDVSIDNDRINLESSQKVYVGGIPYYSNEDDIRSYFEGCGTITFIDCMTFPDTGKFRGIAFITFKTEAAAKRALALDGSDMGGFFLKIQPFKPTKENKLPNFAPSVEEGYNRIYVGNLAWDITEDDLKNTLVGCAIKSIRFGQDKETGEFKGYAHVDFDDSLSLKTALNLDQTVVCGRPIKISCAVKKGTAFESKPIRKDNQVENGKGVAAASLKAPPKDYQVNAVAAAASLKVPPEDYQVDHYNTSSVTTDVGSKIRRRTCYECGEKGHLSSACPKIQAAAPTNPGTQPLLPAAASLTVPPEDYQVDHYNTSSVTTDVSSKIRRRTCYECGEKGHLSSVCPKIQAAAPTNPGTQPQLPAAASLKVPQEDYQVDYYNTSVEVEKQVTSSVTADVSSKIRRRTCYECGEKGHLSSACPKIQAATPTNPGTQLLVPAAASLKVPQENYQVNHYNASVEVEKQVPSSVSAAMSSKIRRRTCYECGEKGHLSSDCPKVQAAGPTTPGTA
ncbi:phragmoplastin interacting protein 1-like [Salvia hispanica]|uniref:phragmoplastin interacting protein 1-like n=1 Tax=Salvia hispanica TaxID=49212 RepID=UPI002009C0DB|nr:phragmoplastin interacting protein 1-like [Salvia hispanica]